MAFFAALLAACAVPPEHNAESSLSIPVYNYHHYPPYVIDAASQKGLSYAWVTHMNRYLSGVRLELVNVDRQTLNGWLKQNTPGLILWGNLHWFGAFPGIKASNPIFLDGDMLVSASAHPVTALRAQAGYRMCAIRGYVYPTTDPWIENGALTRMDRASTGECMQAVRDNQADILLMNRSQWFYLSDAERQSWYMMPEPIDAFARQLLVTPQHEKLLPEFNQAIKAVNQDPAWQQMLLNYGSDDFLNLFELNLQQLQTLPLP